MCWRAVSLPSLPLLLLLSLPLPSRKSCPSLPLSRCPQLFILGPSHIRAGSATTPDRILRKGPVSFTVVHNGISAAARNWHTLVVDLVMGDVNSHRRRVCLGYRYLEMGCLSRMHGLVAWKQPCEQLVVVLSSFYSLGSCGTFACDLEQPNDFEATAARALV